MGPACCYCCVKSSSDACRLLAATQAPAFDLRFLLGHLRRVPSAACSWISAVSEGPRSTTPQQALPPELADLATLNSYRNGRTIFAIGHGRLRCQHSPGDLELNRRTCYSSPAVRQLNLDRPTNIISWCLCQSQQHVQQQLLPKPRLAAAA